MTLTNKLRHIGYALSVGTLSVLAVNVESANALPQGNSQPTEVTRVSWKSFQYDFSNVHTGPGVLECNQQVVNWSHFPLRVCRIADSENGGYFHFATLIKHITHQGKTAYANVNEWSDSPKMINANRLDPKLFQLGSGEDVAMNTNQGEMISTDGGFYYHVFTPIR